MSGESVLDVGVFTDVGPVVGVLSELKLFFDCGEIVNVFSVEFMLVCCDCSLILDDDSSVNL